MIRFVKRPPEPLKPGSIRSPYSTYDVLLENKFDGATNVVGEPTRDPVKLCVIEQSDWGSRSDVRWGVEWPGEIYSEYFDTLTEAKEHIVDCVIGAAVSTIRRDNARDLQRKAWNAR